ncbi:hypothetical protein [Streptomyces sp. NPDC087300]|uniref:hypothetical protein n=1 Tax=Streptomyces sp. NPDC087300 TaxID=3365780 RepID=UPI00381A310B
MPPDMRSTDASAQESAHENAHESANESTHENAAPPRAQAEGRTEPRAGGPPRPGRTRRRWFDSWWATGLLVTVVFAGSKFLLRGYDLWSAVVAGAVSGAVLTAVLMYGRRRDARAVGAQTDTVPALDRRIRREDLPGDPAERASMLRLARRRRKQMGARTRAHWIFAVSGVVLAVFGVLLLVLGQTVLGLCWLVGTLVFLCWAAWMRRRNERRLARVERELSH